MAIRGCFGPKLLGGPRIDVTMFSQPNRITAYDYQAKNDKLPLSARYQ